MDLSLRDAAKLLNISEATLSRWINAEGLPAFMINGRYRFNRIDLMEWASHRKIPAAALYEHPEGSGAPALNLLLQGNVHHGVPGNDMKSVMAAVAERLPLSNARDKALAAQALSDREAKGSTVALGGIAIPHVRSPLIFGVDRPLLSLCFLENPVSLGGAGQALVRVVLALVTPTVRVHLAMLAKIALALHDAELRELLDQCASEPEILARLRKIA